MKILDELAKEALTCVPKIQRLTKTVNDLAKAFLEVKKQLGQMAIEHQKQHMILFHQAEAIRQLHQFNGILTKNMREDELELSPSDPEEQEEPN